MQIREESEHTAAQLIGALPAGVSLSSLKSRVCKKITTMSQSAWEAGIEGMLRARILVADADTVQPGDMYIEALAEAQ